ncbi:MAG TPA: efflux RND transporter permease subunit, partial [Xanthobacteraceae bacterium]|nr:efflux RND transporter permease subunit [Xanthobacteraceae bacterium]
DVVTRVRAAVERINTEGSLPRGVKIVPFYDRGDLVGITVRTVLHNMLFGIALIFVIQWMFLGNLRCALIVAATIPVALLLAVMITVLRGESANLLSVGAIDLGIIVDATVIMVENIFRHLAHHARRAGVDQAGGMREKLHRVLTAAAEVDKPILFSVIITIAAFLPLFTMQGVEGQIFGPMARTYAYALLGAVIATFTVTPVLSAVLLPEHVNEVETFLVRQFRRVYSVVLPLAVRRYHASAAIALAFLIVCALLAARLGIAGRDDVTDIVTGIVLMQKFERTSEVVTRVRAAIERLNTDGTLPPGVKIDAFYDRGDLVAITVKTVMHNMFFGVALIFLIQWMFLGNLRCALIVSATIPVALFLAVIITVMRGESANLLSVGAIDLGIIVDATVIMVENIFRHLAHDDPAETANLEERQTDKLRRILNAAVEVDKPIFFSVIITIAAFLPLFTMQGVEGQIFGPMSRTYAYALIGAVIATFTVTPVMASILLPAHVQEVETILVRYIRKLYQFVLPRAVRHYRIAATIALAFLLVCGILGARLGTEFLPKLEEGNLWIRALLPPTITLGAGMDTVARMRNVIKSYPAVRTVVSEQGRGDDGTDPDGSFVAEFFVALKPTDEWPRGLTKEEMVRQMSRQLRREFVGVDFNFSQYIQDNIEEAVSGVKGENSVKIFGRDLAELERLSKTLKTEIATVPGVTNPGGFNLLGQPNLIIKIDREKAARYGFSVADINSVVQAAIGGQEVTRVYEGEMNFALTVRFAPEYRRNIDAIRSIPVALPNNDSKGPTAYIALGELGDVKLETGAAYIYRENSQRFVPLKYSVRGRDLGSTVAEAQKVIAERVPLPPGYRIEWTGEFGALVEAQKRLAIIVPLSLLLIMMLLYSLFNSIRDSLLALAGIPFAVAGGILGLYVAGLNFSVSAAIGFISLFGVSSMDGILLVSYIRKNMVEGMERDEAIILAGETRMRQIFMTGLSACIGLVPAALSTGIGAQVQQPLACVVVGGMLLSPICSLLVIPTLARMVMPARVDSEQAGRPATAHTTETV